MRSHTTTSTRRNNISARHAPLGQFAACALLASLAGFAGGYTRSWVQDPKPSVAVTPQVSDEIRTRRLLIVDGSGEVCGTFEAGRGSDQSARLTIQRGGPGAPVAGLRVDNLEGTPTAEVFAWSAGLVEGDRGTARMSSTWGKSGLSLADTGTAEHTQLLKLGYHVVSPETAITFKQRTESVDHWPR